jgi:transcriptional regulator with XRE-family HTH domain
MTTACEGAPAHSPGALRARRIAAGLRQADLAEMAGVTQPYLSLLEGGERTPGLAVLCRLAGALGCTAGDLMPGPGTPS